MCCFVVRLYIIMIEMIDDHSNDFGIFVRTHGTFLRTNYLMRPPCIKPRNYLTVNVFGDGIYRLVAKIENSPTPNRPGDFAVKYNASRLQIVNYFLAFQQQLLIIIQLLNLTAPTLPNILTISPYAVLRTADDALKMGVGV